MCGICGIVAREPAAPVDADALRRMAAAMSHRGPDDEGFYTAPGVGLGARRLSIIDVDGGHQPIANEDGTRQIVFNGEIYNFRELRRFLEAKGHRFSTHSDTEVILHLYEELGAAALDHLNGIFAFAIWDAVRRELFVARDRMGIKPLYYAQTTAGLVFGSELRVVIAHPHVDRRLSLTALNEYLSYEYVPTPRTILQDVARLDAGHYLVSDGRDVRVTQYWAPSLARSENQPPVQWREYASRLRQLLADTVKMELVSDVPVGVLLSGGLDSSTIAAMMTAQAGAVDSFSVVYDEASFDESRYARMVANRFGTRHHELRVTSRMAADLVPRIADVLDEPLGDGSFIPTYMLSTFAREHVKVVLGGDGSDELFGGYPTLLAHRLIQFYERATPWLARAYVVPQILQRLPVSFDYFSREFKLRRFLAGRGVPLEARHHRWMGSFFEEEKTQLFADWVRPVIGDTYALAYQHARRCDARHPLNRVLYDDMKMYLEGNILFKVDRASMAASLEVRVPFLNRKVVEFADQLPLELKLRRTTGKFLLKRAMDGWLPAEIVRRSKQGFAMPVAHWLASELRELATDMLSADRLRRQGLFDPSYVDGLLREHMSRVKDNRKLLWTLLVFQLWWTRYLD